MKVYEIASVISEYWYHKLSIRVLEIKYLPIEESSYEKRACDDCDKTVSLFMENFLGHSKYKQLVNVINPVYQF
jgi:hypothetical protein